MHDLDRLDISDLFQHRAFVRRLAARLTSDSDHAQDVEQATWLRALEHYSPKVRSPRRWLATIVRNLVHSEHRRVRRAQSRRSRARRPSPPEDPAATLQRQEAIEQLMRAVLALDPESRRAVLLRYFQDRTPAEISALTGVPVETIRTRIKRALARLRERLDRSSIGDWRALLLPIAAPSTARVSATASAIAEPSLRAAPTAWRALTLKLATMAGIGLLMWAAVEPIGTFLSASGEPRPESNQQTASIDAANRGTSGSPADDPPEGSSTDRYGEARGAGVVLGRVVEASRGGPVTGVRVVLRQRETGTDWARVSDEQGRFRFDHLPPGPYLIGDARWGALSVAERHAGQWLFAARAFDVTEADVPALHLEAEHRHGVLGRIVMPGTGRGIADLRLDLVPIDPSVSRPDLGDAARRTDPQGRFEWWLERGSYRLLMHRSLGAGSGTVPIGLIDLTDPGAAQEWTFEIPWAGAVEGRVVDQMGRPVCGAQVAVLAVNSMSNHFGRREESTDELGRFRLEHLPTDRDLLLKADRGSEVTMVSGPLRAALTPPSVELKLLPGASLQGRLRTAGGQPCRGTSLTLYSLPAGWIAGSARTDDAGSFERSSLIPGRYVLRFRPESDGPTTCRRIDVPLGGSTTVVLTGDSPEKPADATIEEDPLDLERAPLTLRVVHATTRALLPDAELVIHEPTGRRFHRPVDGRGQVKLDEAATGRYEVWASSLGQAPARITFEHRAHAIEGERVIELGGGRSLEGVVRDRFGDPVSGARVGIVVGSPTDQRELWPTAVITDSEGRFQLNAPDVEARVGLFPLELFAPEVVQVVPLHVNTVEITAPW